MKKQLLDEEAPIESAERTKFICFDNKRTTAFTFVIILVLILLIFLLCYLLFVHESDGLTHSPLRYDFIVIGSGPAGSIVAARLSENNYSVLLLESGNTTQYSLNGTMNVTASTNLTLFDIPLSWDSIAINRSYSKYIFSFTGEITPQCGRSVGGSGAINAMIYIRGTESDFTLANGWIGPWHNYSNLIKYYMRSENNTNIHNSYHNNSGNVHISHNYDAQNNVLSQLFLDSCIQNDFLVVDDMNVPNRSQNICGNYQFLIDHNSEDTNQTIRDSVARAFLRNEKKSKTLKIEPNAMAINVIFDADDKTRAIGVNYIDLSDMNKVKTVYANNEIILSAGTLNTPTILMQSGVGNADILKNDFSFSDDDIMLNNSQVGRNYADGVFTNVQWNVSDKLIDSFTLCTPWNSTFGYDDNDDVNRCKMEWGNYTKNKFGKSIFDTTGFNVGGFFKSPFSNNTLSNDIQITIQPFDILGRFNKTNIVTAQIANNLPKSLGYIQWNHLNNVNHLNEIIVDGSNIKVIGNYLTNSDDINALVFGINVTRKIFDSFPSAYILSELSPGYYTNSDAELGDYVMQNAGSADHIIGSCKIGKVVDDRLKVIGLKNLRIADASIMASLPSGNTHASTMMIGEYAAEMILIDNRNSLQ